MPNWTVWFAQAGKVVESNYYYTIWYSQNWVCNLFKEEWGDIMGPTAESLGTRVKVPKNPVLYTRLVVQTIVMLTRHFRTLFAPLWMKFIWQICKNLWPNTSKMHQLKHSINGIVEIMLIRVTCSTTSNNKFSENILHLFLTKKYGQLHNISGLKKKIRGIMRKQKPKLCLQLWWKALVWW